MIKIDKRPKNGQLVLLKNKSLKFPNRPLAEEWFKTKVVKEPSCEGCQATDNCADVDEQFREGNMSGCLFRIFRFIHTDIPLGVPNAEEITENQVDLIVDKTIYNG